MLILLQISYQNGGPTWLWSHGSWIYNYLCNQCLSPLTLRVRIPLRQGLLNITLCDKVCNWHVAGRWFSQVSSTNTTNHHDTAEILLKVALNTIILTPIEIGKRKMIWKQYQPCSVFQMFVHFNKLCGLNNMSTYSFIIWCRFSSWIFGSYLIYDRSNFLKVILFTIDLSFWS
jgi:hypothetical protein